MPTLNKLLAALALVLLPAAAPAGPLLSLVPPAGIDLNSLQPGQTLTFQVVLGGLNTGDRVAYLGARVAFDDTLFAAPTIAPALTANGGIVPEADGFDGTTFPSPGAISGFYDALFATNGTAITANGAFFTFTLTVQGSGAGTVGIDYSPLDGSDSNDNPLPPPVTSPPLNVVAPAAEGVPEPATAVLLLAALATGAACRGRRARCRMGSYLRKLHSTTV